MALAGCQPPDAPPPESEPLTEVRGVWLTNVDSEVLDSREAIDDAMRKLAEANFNVVYPVVWNGGYTLYPSAVMDSLFGASIDPRFEGRDPLADLVEAGEQYGLVVIPWFEFGFSSSYNENGGRLLAQFPAWAARDADGGLLTKNGFEWMNPYHPEVQDFLLALILEVVRAYDVDGVQGDDRLPANPSEGGYSAYTDSLYRADHAGAAPPRDTKDPDWLRWRADRLNQFGKRVYEAVKAEDPGLLVTWSPSVFPWAYEEYLQDWPSWLAGGYADLLHPQVYRYDLDAYRATLGNLNADTLSMLLPAGTELPEDYKQRIAPGVLMRVGDYVIDEPYLFAALRANRDAGFPGEVFFFYEGLTANDGRLFQALKDSLYTEPARFPSL